MGLPSDTIAALATPVGTAAIAVVRASGPGCSDLARALIGREPPARVATYTDYHDREGLLLDDVLVTFFQGPQSYTAEDSLEISCHGNPFIAQAILEDLCGRGCRLAEEGEFTRRAFLNGRLDLSQAEAVMDLIHARSERARTAANQQLRGSLGRHLGHLTDSLLLILARVEAYIDFPEEDLPAEDRTTLVRTLDDVLRGTSRLLATSHYGELLRDGVKTVIIGEPNVGKSSLLNRLLGRDRAVVSDQPGTTRDYLEEPWIIGPHCLRLIDTAGLNSNPETLEQLGIDKTRERLEEADLILLVMDATRPAPTLPEGVIARLHAATTLVVRNKTDILEGLPPRASAPNGLPTVDVSALTGAGLSSLTELIVRKADAFRLEQGDEIIAINARHADALRRAKGCLEAAKIKLTLNDPIELLASDLRGALDACGEICGKIDNERMLDHLFATFCIGK